jgi:nucleoside-diphosphate-sugar epimerase
MKICIVGGTGNISTGIAARLIEQGHEVVCFNRGKSAGLPAGARAVHGDRADRPAFEKAMQAEKFDAAIDMICFKAEQAASSVRAFHGVRHFIQCSTVCTYGIQSDWLPVTEDHPLRPISDYGKNKVAADNVFMEAFHREKFPVTIIKPSTTYGPKMGMLRQVAWEFSWIDRIRKGKPIVICGDGNTLIQHLHVDDAAPAFAGVLGREHCIGRTYNMVRRGFITWADYHRTAMKVIGREVQLVGIPLADLATMEIPEFGLCRDIFAHHAYYSSERLMRDVPEFAPKVSLEEGMRRVIEAMDREGRIPDSDKIEWEDRAIAAQMRVRGMKKP